MATPYNIAVECFTHLPNYYSSIATQQGLESLTRLSPVGRPNIALAVCSKKVAERHKVLVVFSAPHKVGRLCVQISGAAKKKKCEKKHAKRLMPCGVGGVYEVPLSCGEAYIGQTGRYVNDGARQHNSSLDKNRGAQAIQSFTVQMQTFLREDY